MEVVYQDERYTSKLHFDPSIKQKKTVRQKDKYSAALILQGYLDRTKKIKRTLNGKKN